MSVELREPDPMIFAVVSGEQGCSLRTCEVLAAAARLSGSRGGN